jgi:hypothetical protein
MDMNKLWKTVKAASILNSVASNQSVSRTPFSYRPPETVKRFIRGTAANSPVLTIPFFCWKATLGPFDLCGFNADKF